MHSFKSAMSQRELTIECELLRRLAPSTTGIALLKSAEFGTGRVL